MDLLGTAGVSFLVARYGLRRSDKLTFVLVFIILMLTAFLMHEAFCVNTRLNAWVFGRAWPSAAEPAGFAAHGGAPCAYADADRYPE